MRPGSFLSGRDPAASRLERRIVRRVRRAVADHELLADGDRIMVCLSGGKDSYVLLDALRLLARRVPYRTELVAVAVDQGWPGADLRPLAAWLEAEGVEHVIERSDWAGVVEAETRPGQSPCALCSRFRRAFLYDLAPRLGCTKIALGHHADDLIQTLFLNLLYEGRLGAMPARLVSDDGRAVVIRPLVTVLEEETAAYAASRGYPIVQVPCAARQAPDPRRRKVARLLADVEAAEPGRKLQILAAMGNVNPDHLLDRALLRALAGGAAGPGPHA